MEKLNRDIKYINRDFNDFRSRLIDYSKVYFPNTFNNFSISSLGMMFMEQASYVGDVLSFYLDNQLQENFIQYTRQTNNLFELAYMFGYKPKTTGTSQVELEIFQQLPAKSVGSDFVPDYEYALEISSNSTISGNGQNFLIQESVDFSRSSSLDPTEVSIYQTTGNQPAYFLLKKKRTAISSTIVTKSFPITTPEPFLTLNISDNNIIKILDITDLDGNIWYEVDNLGQEMVFKTVKNTNINDPNRSNDAPYILKLLKSQYRFVSRFTSLNNLQLQFGVGSPSDNDEEITPNPNNVGIGLPFKQEKLTAAYSPTNFLYTGTYGISPSNTTLRVRYLVGGGASTNVAANTLTNIDNISAKFQSVNINPSTSNYIRNSIGVNNPQPATGGKGGDTIEEIRQNTLALISSQKRSVTSEDYLIRALSMPSDFGSISKAYIEKPKLTDNQISTSETLCLYVLSLNGAGKLDYAGDVLKQNLRTYLSQYRMIGDSIEIKDAYIVNIGIEFEIIVLPNYNNNDVLTKCITSIQSHFSIENWDLNQPIFIRDLYIKLDKIEGVQTVKNVLIQNKVGTTLGYSQYAYDIDGATQNQVIYPSLDPSIFEIRYPNQDIKGRVVPL
tara:strand:+ start:3583 stop:5424 length:1842 start_codon:yes stop_codon:yes gene_type:complete